MMSESYQDYVDRAFEYESRGSVRSPNLEKFLLEEVERLLPIDGSYNGIGLAPLNPMIKYLPLELPEPVTTGKTV